MNRVGLPHIGYLVQQFPPEVGAGPARVVEMARRWVAAGARVTVVTGMPNRPAGRIHPDYRGKLFLEEDWEGMRVLRSWLYASPRGGFARTVVNNLTFMSTAAVHGLARARGIDVLIASSPPFFVHLAGAALGTLKRIPVVLEVRDLWPDYLVGMGMLRGWPAEALFALERRLLLQAEHVVAVTESFRRRLVRKGVAQGRLDVIPNGVDTGMYRRANLAPPIDTLRREGVQEFIVGYMGNFGAGQGLRTVLEAAAILADQAPDVRLVLAGDGPDRPLLEATATALRNVAIHPPIPKEATPAFYNACDICVVPLASFGILQETIPSKIFEVMACERPVLASLGGEAAKLVEESESGLVVPPGDARAMADGVLRLRALGEERRAEMGRRGRAYVAEGFARDTLADRYLELLQRVSARSGRRRS